MIFTKQKTAKSRAEIFFFNTETKKVETFSPLKSGNVRMYSCGPTVYDSIHIGNLRAFFLADIVKRTLQWNGYKVKHVMNFTDFGHLTDDGDAGEDKIMNGLKRAGRPISLQSMREFTDIHIATFLNDSQELRLIPPTKYTRASDYISQQIQLIKTLEQKGYTYETSDGLYFDISKYNKYGRLGNIKIDTIKKNARIEMNEEKKHPADFALWKKGLLGWDSAWGKGFPGWHIECSAMAISELGKQIDIHTGGIDLHTIHHNAEIAQCECATGKKFVQYWLHNEFLQFDGNKIGKSLGNAITLRQLLDRGFSGDDYRFFLLMSHYRSQANFSFEALQAAKNALFRIKRYIYEEFQNKNGSPDSSYLERFTSHINNDLDTPGAVALLHEIIKDKHLSAGVKCATLKKIDDVLGIGLSDTRDSGLQKIGVVTKEALPPEIQDIVNKRNEARKNKDWEESDRLRELINLHGYTIEDSPQGTKISKKNN
jgi:cysteinyl-tRNA synthetase